MAPIVCPDLPGWPRPGLHAHMVSVWWWWCDGGAAAVATTPPNTKHQTVTKRMPVCQPEMGPSKAEGGEPGRAGTETRPPQGAGLGEQDPAPDHAG